MSNRLTAGVHHRINSVFAEQWSYLFHDSPHNADMAEILDTVGTGGLKLYSILVCLDGAPILLLPLFETIHPLMAAMDGAVKKMTGKIDRIFPRVFKLRLLRVGIVDQQYGQVGYDPRADLQDLGAAWNLALKELENVAGELKTRLMLPPSHN